MANQHRMWGRQTPRPSMYIKGQPNPHDLTSITDRRYFIPTYLRPPLYASNERETYESLEWNTGTHERRVLSESEKEAIRAEFNWQVMYGMYGIPHPKYRMMV